MAEERRGELRVETELEVTFRTAQEFLAAYTKNISGGGLYIRTTQPLPLNQTVLLRFTLPGVAPGFQVPGLVVWSNPVEGRTSFPAGMGVKFTGLSPTDAARIQTYLQRVQAGQNPAARQTGPESQAVPPRPAAPQPGQGARPPGSGPAGQPARPGQTTPAAKPEGATQRIQPPHPPGEKKP